MQRQLMAGVPVIVSGDTPDVQAICASLHKAIRPNQVTETTIHQAPVQTAADKATAVAQSYLLICESEFVFFALGSFRGCFFVQSVSFDLAYYPSPS